MPQADIRPFNRSVITMLIDRTAQRDDARALEVALKKGDLDEAMYRLLWICADQAPWLQEMFFLRGPNVERMSRPAKRHLNSARAYTDLFMWLLPEAQKLLQTERYGSKKRSALARAKRVLATAKERDFRDWQQKDEEKRGRWNFAKLTTEHMVKTFSQFLNAYESGELDHVRLLLKDHRADALPKHVMLEIQAREHAAIEASLK